MGRIFAVELEGRSYRCKFCKTHLAVHDDLVSRSFHSRRGKAYLFNHAIVGWKYEAAHEKTQKYKEGRFVLERGRIVDEIDSSSEVYMDTRCSTSDAEDA